VRSGAVTWLPRLEFSNAYAEQNQRDYEHLTGAVTSGKIVAQTGL